MSNFVVLNQKIGSDTKGETLNKRTKPRLTRVQRYQGAPRLNYGVSDEYTTSVITEFATRMKLGSSEGLTTTTLNICNALSYELQKSMTKF